MEKESFLTEEHNGVHHSGGFRWAIISVNRETGAFYSTLYEEVHVGGAYGSKVIEKQPVSREKVQELASRELAECPDRWDREKFIAIIEGNWEAVFG